MANLLCQSLKNFQTFQTQYISWIKNWQIQQKNCALWVDDFPSIFKNGRKIKRWRTEASIQMKTGHLTRILIRDQLRLLHNYLLSWCRILKYSIGKFEQTHGCEKKIKLYNSDQIRRAILPAPDGTFGTCFRENNFQFRNSILTCC